ncbi:hypothetical protein EMCRGX_G032944 [Ephydatia muelleri]
MVEEIPRGHMRMLHGGNAECICKDAGVDVERVHEDGGEDAERVHETPREISSERIHEDAGNTEEVYTVDMEVIMAIEAKQDLKMKNVEVKEEEGMEEEVQKPQRT